MYLSSRTLAIVLAGYALGSTYGAFRVIHYTCPNFSVNSDAHRSCCLYAKCVLGGLAISAAALNVL